MHAQNTKLRLVQQSEADQLDTDLNALSKEQLLQLQRDVAQALKTVDHRQRILI